MKKELMTAQEFAEAMDANYWTVMRWLRTNRVPGASKQHGRQLGNLKACWVIPVSALKMTRPVIGRPRIMKGNNAKNKS